MGNTFIKNTLYSLYDLFTGKRGIKKRYSGVDIRLPVRVARFFPEDYEKENAAIIAEHVKKGMTVIDIGAHIGLTTVMMSNYLQPDGIIYAFEPTPTTCNTLKETIRLNRLGNLVVPVQAALSSKSGKEYFYISNHAADNSNSLVNNDRKDRRESRVEVQLYSLDDFTKDKNIAAVDFIKIDAEGAELQVLKGMTENIARRFPKMILSLHPRSIQNGGDSLDKIWDFVKSFGYRVELNGRELSREDFVSRTELFDVFLLK